MAAWVQNLKGGTVAFVLNQEGGTVLGGWNGRGREIVHKLHNNSALHNHS